MCSMLIVGLAGALELDGTNMIELTVRGSTSEVPATRN